jgi:hypothetical protein
LRGRWDKYADVLRASVARQCLEAGLLDEIVLCVAGAILGDVQVRHFLKYLSSTVAGLIRDGVHAFIMSFCYTRTSK